jgi:hypothetical protein
MDGQAEPRTRVVHCPPEVPVHGTVSSGPRQCAARGRVPTNPSTELVQKASKQHVFTIESKHVQGIDPKQSTLGDRVRSPGTLFLEEWGLNPRVPSPPGNHQHHQDDLQGLGKLPLKGI